jgi:outer membrane protein assembly factor BamB
MSEPSTPRRPLLSRWWLAGLCLTVFALLTIYQLTLADRVRFTPHVNLMAELNDAIFRDEELNQGPHDWPQWRGPLRTGFTRQPDLTTNSLNKPVWQAEGGDGYSSLAVSAGRVFTMVATDGQEAVLALDADKGTELWRHAYRPARSFDYGGPRATPTVQGDWLYTLGSAGNLMCINVHTGKLRWEVNLPEKVGAIAPKWGFACSPLLDNDRLFVIAGGTNGRCLAAFTPANGDLLWATQDDSAAYSSPIAIDVAGKRQIVCFTAHRLMSVDPANGKLLWELPWVTSFDVNASTPLPIKGPSNHSNDLDYLFISTGYGKGSALVRVDGVGGQAAFVYETNALCCHFSSPVRHGDYLYGIDEQRQLTCLELKTGEVKWRQTGFQKGNLILVEGDLLVFGENGKLVICAATPEGFVEKAKGQPFRVGRGCWAAPAVAQGRVYLRDQQKIVCLDLRSRMP